MTDRQPAFTPSGGEPARPGASPAVIVAALAMVLLAGCSNRSAMAQVAPPPVAQPGVPSTIDPATLGPPSFDETFATFDHGVDQSPPPAPHRWRTVFGLGPASRDNRTETQNHEDEIYVDPAFGGLKGCAALGIDPFVARPGLLTIRARRLAPREAACLERGWASGLMTTQLSFAQKWGYFEADMDIPLSKGFWPAFWMLPVVGPWPSHGEIDVLESVGPASPGGEPRQHVGVVWMASKDRSRQEAGGFAGTLSPGFHKYGVLWTPKTINYYFDRHLVATTPTPDDLTQPMYMLINLAVGAKVSWPGEPDPATRSAELHVRRVAAWKLP